MHGLDDLRLESLIAWYLENEKVALDNITVKSSGTFERSVSKDIGKIEPEVIVPGEEVTIHLNREGLYDMLPEGLFHQATRKARRTLQEAVQQTKQYKAEEREARKLFLPLEQEFYRHKIATEVTELGTCIGSARAEHVNAFVEFWDLPGELLTYEQKSFALALLPQLHRIVGDNQKVARCLEVLLGEKISVRATDSYEIVDMSIDRSILGEIVLGVDSILDANVLVDEEAVEVLIGPIKLETLEGYLAGAPKDQLLNRLYRYFFPSEVKVMASIILEEASGNFLLTEEQFTSRLGFTTVLT